MTYVPKSTKLILEAKQQLHNDVVQHSFIISYNIQYTHILDELTSYIRKEFIAFLQIIGWLTAAVSMGYSSFELVQAQIALNYIQTWGLVWASCI